MTDPLGKLPELARRRFRVLRQVVVDAHPRQLGGHENVALGREPVRVVESSERNPHAPCAGPLRQHASAARRAEDAPELWCRLGSAPSDPSPSPGPWDIGRAQRTASSWPSGKGGSGRCAHWSAVRAPESGPGRRSNHPRAIVLPSSDAHPQCSQQSRQPSLNRRLCLSAAMRGKSFGAVNRSA